MVCSAGEYSHVLKATKLLYWLESSSKWCGTSTEKESHSSLLRRANTGVGVSMATLSPDMNWMLRGSSSPHESCRSIATAGGQPESSNAAVRQPSSTLLWSTRSAACSAKLSLGA